MYQREMPQDLKKVGEDIEDSFVTLVRHAFSELFHFIKKKELFVHLEVILVV